ncbi:centrosomin isoform X2 [Phlebotomus argentipes]|uniref:centrosomin isoform X2 n=1 Tax=Phlebotomus argentipes TaxID=94469 RepID=UPI002892C5A4|nr:centrosomin isoform X2 [Phlebotomus argentipes]
MERKSFLEVNETMGNGETTSPGQLQDVTMNNSYTYGFGSPSFSACGQGSPGQGRSVRDYEEQMTTLQRENFNLRLRIYFLEEKLNGSAMGQGTESLFKQNVDLKVEIEAQKKELQEKHELLTQAASAMKYMEDTQKKVEEEAKATESELKTRIDLLELEISEMQKIYGPNSLKTNLISLVEGDNVVQRESRESFMGVEVRIKELQVTVDELTAANEEVKEAMKQLEAINEQKTLKVKEFEVKTDGLSAENARLKENLESLEKNAKLAETLKVQLLDVRKQLAEKLCDEMDLKARLQEKTKAHENAKVAIEKLVRNIGELKMNPVTSENVAATLEDMKVTIENKDVDIANLRAEIMRTVEQKNAEIFELKTEVKRKTTNLQRLINKDLWDKNREIERLTKLVNGGTGSPVKMVEVDQLHGQFTEAQYNEAVEKNGHLQRKLDDLRQKLCHNVDSEKTVRSLQKELTVAQAEVESANRMRKECGDVCSILTLRLEELAGFLDSLLKHKDILGALCADRRHAMRKAIDRSLDLSRSINNNSSLNLGISLSEQSLMQMTGFSAILDESFPESVFSNKENVPENGNVIEALRNEVLLLRTELDKSYKRKEQMSDAKKRSHRQDGHSESESWSEPDRNVSAARIGIQTVQETSRHSSTDEDSAAVMPMKKSVTSERLSQLECLVTDKENKLLEIQISGIERENVLKEERLRANEQLQAAQKELQAQKLMNENLEREIVELRSSLQSQAELQQQLQRAQTELSERSETLDAVSEERDKAAVDLRVAEMQMETMARDAEYLKEKHTRELLFRLEKVRKECEVELDAQLQRQEMEHRETVSRDFVARTVLVKKQEEIDVLRRRLEDAQATVDGMSEGEIELRALLAEHEKRARDAQKSLDDATMQASRAVVERTRAVTERGQLEVMMKDLQAKCDRLMGEKAELKALVEKFSRERSSDDGRGNNSSPDLGIDSDAARASSSDAGKTDAKPPVMRLSSASTVEMQNSSNNPEGRQQEYDKVREENVELKKRLARMTRQFEEMRQRLKKSNSQKEEIERNIQMQILKTHSVLKQVRSNMESEAEKRNVPLPGRSSDPCN